MRVLLAAHPTVGHTQSLRAIGRALLQRQHRVRFAITVPPPLPNFLPVPAALKGAGGLAAGIAADGFTLVPLRAGLSMAWAAWKVSTTRGYDELDWALKLFTGDAVGAARAIRAALEAEPADLVIADCFHFGAWLAAEALGVPYVALFHSGLPFPAPGQPPFGSPLHSEPAQYGAHQQRLDRLVGFTDAALGQARRALGLPALPPGVLSRPYARALNVLTTFEAFELPRPQLAASAAGPVLWAGPCLGTHRPKVEFPWEKLGGSDKPIVYVSLGTVFNDQPEIYQTLLAGVHAAGARAVVAAGASYDALLPVARADDVVVKFAPQVELLPRMKAVIVHGGNNSTNESLRAGKPFLAVPFGGEQVANARRAVALGVARAIDPQRLSGAAVAEALKELLTDEAAARSTALALAVPQEDGVPRVIDALTAVVG